MNGHSPCKWISFLAVLSVSTVTYGSKDTIGPNGINSDGLMTAVGGPLNGSGVPIGQVEQLRPGLPGFDFLINSHPNIIPAAVFRRNGSAVANEDIGDGHALRVAGVMISTVTGMAATTPSGVSPNASLYSSAYMTFGIDPGYQHALLAMQHVGKQGAHAINHSWAKDLEAGSDPDGNSLLTLGVDWAAAKYDVLHVVAGNESTDAFSLPSDNFNGLTVGTATKDQNGVYRLVSALNRFDDDAEGRRTSIGLIAPGDDVNLADIGGGTSVGSGTSFAAPHVTGTVALLQHYVLDQLNAGAPRFDPMRSRRHELMKAVLLNSADKLGGVHGSNRLILDQNGMNWLQSEALIGPNADLVPLDDQMGAGHLNASRAVQQISSGEYDPDGIFGVPVIGWDYDSTTGTDDINKYVFDEPLLSGSYVAITIAYDRAVYLADDSGIIGEYDFGDTFEPYEDFIPHADDVINDLDLYLLPKDATDFEQAIAVSTSSDSTIDHIFAQIPTTGEYEFWVHQWDSDIQFQPGQDYAVAWWAVGLTPPTVVGDYDGNGSVGPEDYGVWRANFGSTNAMADGNGDGIVDAADYVVWRKNLTAGSGSFAAVPEPSSAALLIVAIALLGMPTAGRVAKY